MVLVPRTTFKCDIMVEKSQGCSGMKCSGLIWLNGKHRQPRIRILTPSLPMVSPSIQTQTLERPHRGSAGCCYMDWRLQIAGPCRESEGCSEVYDRSRPPMLSQTLSAHLCRSYKEDALQLILLINKYLLSGSCSHFFTEGPKAIFR